MTFQRAPYILVPNFRALLHVLLLCGAVIIVLSQFLQFGKAQVLYLPASEYGNANLTYTPEAYNPENVFDVFSVFESIRELINASQHDASLSAPIGRLNLFLRRVDGAEGTSFCTASLISDRHIITNYHCIPGIDKNIRVERATLRLGYLSEGEEGQEFKVNMRPLESNPTLDYSILELAEVPGNQYGTIDLSAVRDPKPLENLFIIHHPGGKPKAMTRERCYMHPSWDLISSSEIFHKCDTQAGSSGAIVFSDSGEPVGIHWGGYDESLPLEARYNVAKKLTTIIQNSSVLRQITGATATQNVPTGNGLLKLSSSPLGAEVYINGEFIGNTPVQASIPEGNYKASLKLRGHEEFAANVIMQRDAETAGSLQLKPLANNNIYSVADSQHKPQALVMPESLQNSLVDPYAAYATPPATTNQTQYQVPYPVANQQPNPQPYDPAYVLPNGGSSNGSNIIIVSGAGPFNPNTIDNALQPYITTVTQTNTSGTGFGVTIPTHSGYITTATTTTDGSPTSAFSNSAAVNPNLTNTIYTQTPIDLDPINPTKASDDTVGLNGPHGVPWQVIGRGESANMERMGFVIVHDPSTLFKVWARAYGNVSVVPALPSIDFARESVVGVFLGIQPAGGSQLQVSNVLLKSEAAHVYVDLGNLHNNTLSQGFVSSWILLRIPKTAVDTVVFYDSATSSLLGIAEKQ